MSDPIDPSRIEWQLLGVETSTAAVDRACADASAAGVGAIVLPPAFVRQGVERLREARSRAAGETHRAIELVSVVSYPLGQSKATIKAIEATSLVKDGVAAIEVTPLPAHLFANDLNAMRAELLEIVRGARAARSDVIIRVRIDLEWLSKSAILADIGTTIVQSACDGIVLVSAKSDQIASLLKSLQPMTGLSVKVDCAEAVADYVASDRTVRIGIPDPVGHVL